MKHILTILFLASFYLGFSQEYRFDKLSIEDGLSQISINALAQDDKGFLWIGTQDGLNRFDGRNFTVFKNVPFEGTSLAENYINALNVDSNGNLWVGTYSKGLHLFDPIHQEFIRFQHSANDSFSISNDIVRTIYEDQEGNIWVGTPNGLNWLDINYKEHFPKEVRFRRFQYEQNAQRGTHTNRNITAIFRDKKGFPLGWYRTRVD